MKAKKSWREKLADDKGLPRVGKVTGKMSQRWGKGTMVVPAPTEVDALMKQVPKGKLVTINELRAALAAKNSGSWIVEVVKRTEMHRFVVLPKRWIVERTNAWVSINRRLMRDFERYARTVAAFIRLAMIKIMLRRLTRAIACP